MISKINKKRLLFILESLLCGTCYMFLGALVSLIVYHAVLLFITTTVFKIYVGFISVIILTVLSVVYISNYNKKYKKNGSNSSNKRHEDLLFIDDIQREEEYNSIRRNK